MTERPMTENLSGLAAAGLLLTLAAGGCGGEGPAAGPRGITVLE